MDTTALPKGMLLDLDDTILAFDTIADLSWEQTLNKFKHELNLVDTAALHIAIKKSAKDFWSDSSRHRFGRLNLEAARNQIVSNAMTSLHISNSNLLSNIVRTYGIVRTDLIHPIPGAIETLRKLTERNIPMILVTNGDAKGQRYKIEKFGLQDFFQSILIEGECGFGKPDERVYLRAISELKLSPEDVWMVGDNLNWEVITPQRLGIRGIWIDYRGIGLPNDCTSPPYRIVSTLREILL